jgi:hypothetical protein
VFSFVDFVLLRVSTARRIKGADNGNKTNAIE